MGARNIRALIAIAVIAATLLWALPSVAIGGAPTAEATRTIDPKTIAPGATVEVTLHFESLLDHSGPFGLVESIPEGWEYTVVDDGDASAVKQSGTIEWLWLTLGAGATKTVVYTLTAPDDASAQDYTIHGVVKAAGVDNPILGHDTVTVDMEVAPPDRPAEAARTIDPQSVPPGETVQVTVEFTSLLGYQEGFALVEEIPQGWVFESIDDGDASFVKESGPIEWLWLAIEAGATRTVVYTLTAPDDADAAEHTIDGVVKAAGADIPVLGDHTVTVEKGVVTYNLTILISPEGTGTTVPGVGTYTYAEGEVVDLAAMPEAGYQFNYWTGNVDAISDTGAAETTITMTDDYSVTANFQEEPPLPTVTTEAAAHVTTSSATLRMEYTFADGSPVEVRFVCKRPIDPDWFLTPWASQTKAGTYAYVLTGLAGRTQYEFKAQLRYDDTVIEGEIQRFTTAESSPVGLGLGDVACFIATAAYGTSTAQQLDVLREFRDKVLMQSTVSRQFVALYYRLSPPVAEYISGSDFLRTIVRKHLVDPVVWMVEATGRLWRD